MEIREVTQKLSDDSMSPYNSEDVELTEGDDEFEESEIIEDIISDGILNIM